MLNVGDKERYTRLRNFVFAGNVSEKKKPLPTSSQWHADAVIVRNLRVLSSYV